MDTLDNGNYDLKFAETNAGLDSIWEVQPNWRNVAYWDGVPVSISEPRPALALGELTSLHFSFRSSQ
jgi:hypothetical protein